MIFAHKSYRSYLKEVLADRTTKNPKYSLRALAMQLGFSHSTLSEVIRGSANFSIQSAEKLATKLNLSEREREYLLLLIQFESTSDLNKKEKTLIQMQKIIGKKISIHDLSVDQFRQISEWYHSAILEMMDLNDFDFTPTNVAKKLGISKIEAEAAIERLTRLELIESNALGKYSRTHDQFLIESNPNNFPAFRNFFRQMLQKASDALETQSSGNRVSGYETMSIAPEAIPEAKEITDRYFSEMISLSRRYPKKKNVYHLIVHFFNLTHEKV